MRVPNEDRESCECVCPVYVYMREGVCCVCFYLVVGGTCVPRVFGRLGGGGSAWRHASRARADGTDYTHTFTQTGTET